MAVLSKEDFLTRINERIGDDNSDEAIAFMEDMSDTYEDMANKITDSTDWKKKYEENDKAWRDKYKERFISSHNEDEDLSGNDDTPLPKTFDDLFKKEG
jgi:CRISPR/Cas system CSM-associated protein Csm5 (group 7 of RAMP superfamily)